MLKALRLAFKTTSNAGLLPAFGWALLAVAVLSLSVGLYGGYEWRKGRDAIADVAQLKAERKADRDAITQLKVAAQQLQQTAVDRAVAYDDAWRRMDAVAVTLEKHLEQDRQFDAAQDAARDALAARRPDLRDMRLGDEFLQHWNRSNAGPGKADDATGPAARPAGQPAKPLPNAAPGTQQRPDGAARKPRRGNGPVSAVQRSQRLPAVGLRRVGAHGVELVLQRGGGKRPRRIGMSRA